MIWMIFCGLVGVLAILIGAASSLVTGILSVGIWSGIVFALVIAGLTVYLGWFQVPQKWEWMISEFGRYSRTWKAGPHVLFPYFGFMKVDAKVFMGQQNMALYMADNQSNEFGGGSVDFLDVSAPVRANVFYTVIHAEKATYNIDDIQKAIEDEMDDCIRSYLAHFTMAEAIGLRVHLDLARIMDGDIPLENDGKVSKDLARYQRPADYDEATVLNQVKLWRSYLDDRGVRIDKVIITDVVLSDEIIEQREKVLNAEREAEAAMHTKLAIERLAEGRAAEIKLLVEQGLSEIEAATHIQTLKKWDVVKNPVLIEGGGGGAGFGAQIGAGINATQGGDRRRDQGDSNR